MIVGVPKEIKSHEYRVAVVPSGVRSLVADGHDVLVEQSAGVGLGISDLDYLAAGARIVSSAAEVFAAADLIVKVKEPLPSEYLLLREGQILFTYLHLAAAPELTKALLERKVTGIAYETVQLPNGSLPLLTPMSEVAGRLSIQFGAHWLQKENRGAGVLLGGVPGTPPGNVAILGGGTVGANAAKVALGMGANVTILDINLERLRHLSDILEGRITLLASNEVNVENAVLAADLVVCGTLIPGARAKKIVSRSVLGRMRPGSVVVDVAIDQGGCVEGATPTSFDQPVTFVDDVVLFSVANMPARVANTSTFALTNATFPYVSRLANMGLRDAAKTDPALARGVNVFQGTLASKPVADSLAWAYRELDLSVL
jgi:alanine dehydrogenase